MKRLLVLLAIKFQWKPNPHHNVLGFKQESIDFASYNLSLGFEIEYVSNPFHLGLKDTLCLKPFDNQLSGLCGLIFYTSSSNSCLYFTLNMIKMKLIISLPFKSPNHLSLSSSFLRMTSLVLQATTASKTQVTFDFSYPHHPVSCHIQ